MQVHLSRVLAEFLDVVFVHDDLSAVNVDVVLFFQCVGNGDRGNGTENGAFLRGLGRDSNLETFDLPARNSASFLIFSALNSRCFSVSASIFFLAGVANSANP